MKLTHKNFNLNFFNENFTNFVELNGEHLFRLISISGNDIELNNGKTVTLSNENAELVAGFINENATREILEFSSYEKAKEAHSKEEKAGAIFTQDSKECFYVYSK